MEFTVYKEAKTVYTSYEAGHKKPDISERIVVSGSHSIAIVKRPGREYDAICTRCGATYFAEGGTVTYSGSPQNAVIRLRRILEDPEKNKKALKSRAEFLKDQFYRSRKHLLIWKL